MGKHGIEQWHVIPKRTDLEDIGAPAVPGARIFFTQQLPESVRPHPPCHHKGVRTCGRIPTGWGWCGFAQL
jgi:hypothetical protein